MRTSQVWVSGEFLRKMHLNFQLVSRDNVGEADSGLLHSGHFSRRQARPVAASEILSGDMPVAAAKSDAGKSAGPWWMASGRGAVVDKARSGEHSRIA
jgi:hypothetical protein